MKLIRTLQCLIVAASSILGLQVLSAVTATGAPGVQCGTDSNAPQPFTNGSPLTGLVPDPSPDGYYYLGVTSGAACPVSGTVDLTATLAVDELVPSIGAPGVSPDPSRVQSWWFTFHDGTGSTGSQVAATSVDGVSGAIPCNVPPNGAPRMCLQAMGTSTITLHYHGPDIWNLAGGGEALVRIKNMDSAVQGGDSAIVTDYATLAIGTQPFSSTTTTTSTSTTVPDTTATTTVPDATRPTTPDTTTGDRPTTPDTITGDRPTTPRGCDARPVNR